MSSKNKSKIIDNDGNQYEAKNFYFNTESKILKAIEVYLKSKTNNNKNDNYFFSEAFFNLNENSFISKDTKVKVHKNIFDNENQDPRIYGSTSYGDPNITVINKGIFTSCKLNDKCPPWSIQSEKITHDKVKKDLIYENAILKIYDFPVLYFPKFFHPDPTVKEGLVFYNHNLIGQKHWDLHYIYLTSKHWEWIKIILLNQQYLRIKKNYTTK